MFYGSSVWDPALIIAQARTQAHAAHTERLHIAVALNASAC
jgi:hypothetical protein